MAGSWQHCTNKKDGSFEFDSIENLRDAYEACEEMHFMIRFLSKHDKEKIKEANDAFWKHYKLGG